MVTNLFAGFLSNDPARDWKWNQISHHSFYQNKYSICMWKENWLTCWLQRNVLSSSTVPVPFSWQLFDLFFQAEGSLTYTLLRGKHLMWFYWFQSSNCFADVCVFVCTCAFMFMWYGYFQPCVQTVNLAVANIPHCASMSIGNSSGRLFWWAWGYCVVCRCAASNANEVPLQETVSPFCKTI